MPLTFQVAILIANDHSHRDTEDTEQARLAGARDSPVDNTRSSFRLRALRGSVARTGVSSVAMTRRDFIATTAGVALTSVARPVWAQERRHALGLDNFSVR